MRTTGDPKRAGPALLPVGEVIDDKLEILERIGFGGMAQVYRARQQSLQRDVAVKVTRPTRNRDRDRFLREARSLGRLKHPVSVVAHDAGTLHRGEHDLWYIAMELVNGETLKARIKRDGALPLPEALRIVRDVAEALREAHRIGIVHRDLKPSNIMLQDGEGPRTRVLDFGVAKMLNGDDLGTTDHEVLGSPRYMSPEQFDDEEIDGRSDIFSLGLVMAEMLTGGHPLGEKVTLADMLRWQKEPEVTIPGLQSQPHAVQRFVLRCVRRDPQDRFDDMDALLLALDELKPSPPWRKAALAAAALLAIGLGTMALIWQGKAQPFDEPVMAVGEGETLVLLVPRTSTFWMTTANFAAAAAQDLDRRLVVYGAHEDGRVMRRQAALAGDLDGVGAIISQDFEGQGAPIAAMAASRNIEFFAINNTFEGGIPTGARASVRPDDEQTGYDLARSLVDASVERGVEVPVRILAVHGRSGEAAAENRRAGLARALAEHDDFVLVDALAGDWTQERARDVVRRALPNHTGVAAIWCAGDAMALGAVEGAIRAGREPGGDVLIGGVDWTRDALLAIQDGTLAVSYGGHFMEAGWAVVLAAAGLSSRDPVLIETPMRPATAENVGQVLALLRTGSFQRIDFEQLVLEVRQGRAAAALDPNRVLSP